MKSQHFDVLLDEIAEVQSKKQSLVKQKSQCTLLSQ